MSGIGGVSRYLSDPWDVTVINASTQTIVKYEVVARASIFTTSIVGETDTEQGQCPMPVVTNATANNTGSYGIAQETLAPGELGLVRRHGRTFVRVESQILNRNQRAIPSATDGTMVGSTGGFAFFFAELTASQTFNYASGTVGFTVSHAPGMCDFLATNW